MPAPVAPCDAQPPELSMHLAPPKTVALLAALTATGCFSTIDGPQDEANDGADDGAGAPRRARE